MRIGVPSGVGDVYWCLTKLVPFAAQHGADRVTLCVQKTHLPRALEWANMVDFVDAAEEVSFQPDDAALQSGLGSFARTVPARAPRRRQQLPLQTLPDLDCVLWPNAVVDRGEPLANWLPGLPLDLDFKVRTAPTEPGRVVVYVSSQAINRAWMPGLGAGYWSRLINAVGEATGRVPTLIGANWDLTFRGEVTAACEDLCGRTTLAEVAGILESAAVVVGVISGMTIVANHFRTPTVALYPDKFAPGFASAWVAPDAPYEPIAHADVSADPAELARRVAALSRRTA